MPYVTIKGDKVPIKLWSRFEEVDSAAIKQLRNVTTLPWVAHHVAVMPDVHVGKGATVGSVIAMRRAVAPAAVGVDIGCGMAAVETSLRARDLPDSLRGLRDAIEARVPVGMTAHDEPAWRDAPQSLREECRRLMSELDELSFDTGLGKRASEQLGTLGGGNHFIELCLDGDDRVWLMLHSGSRRIGAALAEHHMTVAQKLGHNRALADRDLASFLAATPEFVAYRRDLFWAQRYALFNRRVMLSILEEILVEHFPTITFSEGVFCHHNYVSEETHFGEELLVTRKGAIRAQKGELGIIPGSMGTRSYIVRGLGNPESFTSASHGAGRQLSRTQAKKRYTLDDLREQTAGVECRKDRGVLDELPGAYKKIERVMAQQQDLVEVVAELKQVLCVKG
jgi:tRNA-splicing ligase RtcB